MKPPKLGIIAGGGELPRLLIRACEDQDRPFCVLLLEDTADAETLALAGDKGLLIRIGAIGKALEFLHAQHASELVMAGRVTRPKLTQLRPDMQGSKLLARLGSSLFSGDNTLLSELVVFFEEQGLRVVGADDVLHDLVTPEGLVGSVFPDKQAKLDIEHAARVAKAIGTLDIGQAVVVQKQHVLGVEAIEGTAALIARCGALRFEERGGVLVKVKKPQQERRVDLPTIGVETIEQIASAGLSGVAVEAGASIMLNRKEIAKRADALGVFVLGFSMAESQ